MRILSVDPGFGRVGFAVLEKEKQEKLIYSECFETKPETPFLERLHGVGKETGKLIKKFNPEVVAIETLFFTTNQKTVMQVAEARGVILYEAIRNGIKVCEYTPLQVKMALTGYGRASKTDVLKMLSLILKIPLDGKKDDELDAVAVGLAHFAYSKNLKER